MKLIHCSDLHLDSKMEALPPHLAAERSAELRLSFERMVRFAVNNGIRAVLIAGDLFDSESVTKSTLSFVLDTIRRAPAVDFLYLRGNHDEGGFALNSKELPQNLRLFSDKWQSLDYGEAVISGIEISAANCHSLYDELSLNRSRYNLVMLHGQVSTQSGEDLVCLPKLKNRGIAYLALGHIHSYEKNALDMDGQWCYCGCLEGRGFDECGEKGFVLIETGESGLYTEFVPFSQRRIENIEVDITDLCTVTELRDALLNAAEGIDRRSLVKFTLTGYFTPEAQKDLRFLHRALSEEFYFLKIKDESRLRISPEDFISDVSLKGAFIREVMASDMTDEEKEHVILYGLRALSGEEVLI